jgi:ribonuclease BN (tRNA processing enzyme)
VELLQALVQTAQIDTVVALTRPDHALPLEAELRALPVRIVSVPAAGEAHNPTKARRTLLRTRLWDAYLADAREYRLGLNGTRLLGQAPASGRAEDWRGRQIGLMVEGASIALGEVVALEEGCLQVRLPVPPPVTSALLVRDAVRGPDGQLNTRRPTPDIPVKSVPPDLQIHPPQALPGGFHPVVRLGESIATLVNGVLGDPLLHLRVRQQRRSLLFDLGEGGRLPTRIAHQVSDVFISHCHFDHIGGFLWLLRSRIGELPICRLWGPPGLAGHIGCLIKGILWDRVGDWGPRFEIGELCGEQLRRWSIQAGQGETELLEERTVQGGLVLDGELLQVRAVTLDHGIPVLAYALETRMQLNVSKPRLKDIGLAGGPWLRELKQRLLAGERNAEVALPDGNRRMAADLERELIEITPGRKLVYATDFADTQDNRRALRSIAKGADVLFLEAGFTDTHRNQALNTGHLTARACGEIAAEARVNLLVPFHFSRRYESDIKKVYREIGDCFPPATTLSPL